MGHASCPFYKTREQAEADKEKANVRLRALPAVKQAKIAEMYYDGFMPWGECV